MDELAFYRTCCERGITICRIPKPMKEETTCWLVQKHPTFSDRKAWIASHTFDSIDEVFKKVGEYFDNAIEPRSQQA
jgi:hypothetical protein